MGILIPFNIKDRVNLPTVDEEIQILSVPHQKVLRDRLQYLIKMVTAKDRQIIRHQTPRKLATIRKSKEYINKLTDRVDLLFLVLFDTEFSKSKLTEKTISAGLLYFVSQNDFLPDDIPGLGYLDDAFIIKLVWDKVLKEVTHFIALKGLDEKLYL